MNEGRQVVIKEISEMVVRPNNDHVLIKVQPEEDYRLIGLVIMPHEAAGHNKKTQIGRVVAVGPGINTRDLQRPITVEIGDKVMFSLHIGFPVSLGDRGDHILIKNNDILGTIEHEEVKDLTGPAPDPIRVTSEDESNGFVSSEKPPSVKM